MPLNDHPLRYPLVNELHARPFPTLKSPCSVAFLALKAEGPVAARNRAAERAHLIDLLDRHGAAHPQPGATHWSGEIGRHMLKWESHTEFVTYTVFSDGVPERPFDPASFDVFPQDWLEQAPGRRVTSILLRVEPSRGEDEVHDQIEDWFVGESLAIAHAIERDAIIAGDFRIDPAGHARFSVFTNDGIGTRRIGRVVQRLCEIETYRAMSMLGLARVRALEPDMARIDAELTRLIGTMRDDATRSEDTLAGLLSVSAELEDIAAQAAYRLAATKAYEAILRERVAMLREERFRGRQTFGEFMMRRYDPAMRTVRAAEARLAAMSARAIRVGELLRTRVDVERSAQNQALLASMDQRADAQLRLQQTVEGLSVVAISYYAVSLVGYLSYPLADAAHLSKGMLLAMVTPLVVLVVWWMIRRIRKRLH
ncbi:DUF3422 domain-containing protein [Pseudooceanicola sediminis]|uniref:DUF3422 domain-containing protein n=1 Tax=Pseudooceanicola sediminis TaxID=2211117 RepID=A0A399J1H6_9RHOB|nr:DUF3422 domain-containing protein [Pseudooceanicola sediminis]KAA2316208.1 DUF3422 domain-containing protein [Puniceibacterium sp. HSS470]RII39120.1 DUF3422 domain-containing protein [Pseudooceanicola sediminis]|tara:strand:+ start:52958 stop:54235 length:1278 start_codon:yes stop_codon:yes gene_type:complete